MDFGLLPPEVNSGRMYAGPGSGPLLTAAAAWDRLAAELATAAGSCEAVIAEMGIDWHGPAATTMRTSASSYLAWMQHVSVVSEQTAGQARAAAAAYESAFAKTVAPPIIAANRSQLTTLVAANIFGQNTPAIAATEAAYGAMWAQDVAAMYGYLSESSGVATLTRFEAPPTTTNPAAAGNQAAAVGSAAAAESSSMLGAIVSGLPAAGSDPALAAAYAGLAASLFGAFVIDSAGSFGVDSAGSFGIDFIGLDVAALLGGLPQFASALPGGVAPLSAGLGQAAAIGGLSVPQAWTVKAPLALQPLSASTAWTDADAIPDLEVAESGMSFGELATAGLAARALAAAGLARPGRTGPARRRHATPALGGPITKIAPELHALGELRDAGLLTDDEFAEQKRALLGPGDR